MPGRARIAVSALGTMLAIAACGDGSVSPPTTPEQVLHLELIIQPTRAYRDSAITPAVTVAIKDARGNLHTSGSYQLSIRLNQSASDGGLLGATSVTTSSGMATFGDLRVTQSGEAFNLTVEATGPNAPQGVSSANFDVLENPIVVDSMRLTLMSDSVQKAQGQFVFRVNGVSPTLPIGAILAGPEGGGFLRKVKSTSLSGTTLTVATEAAALTDVVKEGSIRSTTTLGFAGSLTHPGFPAIQWEPSITHSLWPGVEIDNGTIRLKDVVLWSGGSDRFVIEDGELSFAPLVGLDVDVADWAITMLEARVGGPVTFNASLRYDVNGEISGGSEPIQIASVSKRFATAIGGWPVWGKVVFTWTLVPELGAQGSASVQTGFFASGGVVVGARYANGSWQSLTSPQASLSVAPITVTASASAYARVGARAELTLLLYETVGPYMWAEPFLKADIAADLISNEWNASCTSALNAGIGVSAKIFGYVLADFNASDDFLKSSPALCNRTGALIVRQLSKVSGDGQSASVGSILAAPIVVQLSNGSGNLLPGVPVRFDVTRGGGSVAGASSVVINTDAAGRASVNWRLGASEGPNELTATAPLAQGSPQIFLATGLATTSPESQFKLTGSNYSETSDLNAAVTIEFGSSYRVADWNDLVAARAEVARVTTNGTVFLVTRGGQGFASGSRHYYVHRSDGQVPYAGFFVHASTNNQFWLGSWFGLSMPILAVHK